MNGNCGRLPENWISSIFVREHTSSRFNPNIAHVFIFQILSKLTVEEYKIQQACSSDGSPLPEYTIEPGDIMINF